MYLMIGCSFSKMLSSCQDRVTQIKWKSMYSVASTKLLFRGVRLQFVIQFNVIMVSKVHEEYHLLKRLNQTFNGARSFKKQKPAEKRWFPNFLQKTNSDVKYYGNKQKAQKKAKLHTCKFQNIPQQSLTFQIFV